MQKIEISNVNDSEQQISDRPVTSESLSITIEQSPLPKHIDTDKYLPESKTNSSTHTKFHPINYIKQRSLSSSSSTITAVSENSEFGRMSSNRSSVKHPKSFAGRRNSLSCNNLESMVEIDQNESFVTSCFF